MKSKSAALIISPGDFNDEEYFTTKSVLESSGIFVKTFSSIIGELIGSFGGEANADLLIDNLKIADFDAIVLIGGAGAYKYFDDEKIHNIARLTIKEGKVLAAICIAPVILAKAGVLKGKKATVWNSPLDRSPVKVLKENGVIFENKEVVIDGNIVTGNGPSAAINFAKTLTNILTRV